MIDRNEEYETLHDETERKARELAEEELRKKHSNYEYDKLQIATILEKTGLIKLLLAANSVTMSSLRLAGETLGFISKLFPPIGAIMTGMVTIVELVEALCISKENLKRRAVQAFTSVISLSLTVTAVILAFNPATAAVGATLSAGAMLVATIKNGFLFNNARKDHNAIAAKLAEKNEQLKNPETSTDRKEQLNLEIYHLTVKMEKSREIYIQKGIALASSAISLIGTVILAVAAFATIGAIAANPITLGIVGVVCLGFTLVGSVYSIYRKQQQKNKPVIPSPAHAEHNKHVSDTLGLLDKLDHEKTKELAQNIYNDLHKDDQPIATKKTSAKKALYQNAAKNSEQDDDSEDESVTPLLKKTY
jgi:hypothetical protein